LRQHASLHGRAFQNRVSRRQHSRVHPRPGCTIQGSVHFPRNPLTRSAPPGALELLERMLCLYPHRRITAAEALRDPYFSDVQPPCELPALPSQPCLQMLVAQRAKQGRAGAGGGGGGGGGGGAGDKHPTSVMVPGEGEYVRLPAGVGHKRPRPHDPIHADPDGRDDDGRVPAPPAKVAAVTAAPDAAAAVAVRPARPTVHSQVASVLAHVNRPARPLLGSNLLSNLPPAPAAAPLGVLVGGAAAPRAPLPAAARVPVQVARAHPRGPPQPPSGVRDGDDDEDEGMDADTLALPGGGSRGGKR